jgi:hypothetical protein
MSETKQRLYMILVAAAIAFWGYNAVKRQSGKTDDAPQPVVTSAPNVQTAPVTTPEIGSVRKKPWAKDPFYNRRKRRRINQTQSLAKAFELKAIIYNKTAPSAFLNGRIVRLGDTINGARITKISKRAVTVDDNGREIIITVNRG